MGTLVEVTIFDFPAQAAAEAAREIESLFLDLQHEWDPWEGGSLGQLNAAAQQGAPVTPDADLADLLDRASRISVATGGVFDPAAGAEDPYLRGLAEHLSQEKAVFYGAFW